MTTWIHATASKLKRHNRKPLTETYGDIGPTRVPVSSSGAPRLDGAGVGLRGAVAHRARVFRLLGGRGNFEPAHSRFRPFVLHGGARARRASRGDRWPVGEVAAASKGERVARPGPRAQHCG